MTTDDEWTDKLSDYLDDELTPDERRAVAAHLAGCAQCERTLGELRRVVQKAHAIGSRPPAADLWVGIADRLAREPRESSLFRPADIVTFGPRPARRVSFTFPQLAAAALLVAAVSGALSVKLISPSAPAVPSDARAPVVGPPPLEPLSSPAVGAPQPSTVGFADAQYDAAVADLERTLKIGRGKLDASTIAALEQSLQTIDQAIEQAREAIAADPANSDLNGYLVETRRRKLDLLRHAAALTSEMN